MPYDTYDPLLARDPSTLTRNRLLVRVSAPAEEPVALEEMKLYLRVDHATEDSLIGDLIVAARMLAESWMKRSLVTQTWKLAFDGGIAGEVVLPMGPVVSVSSVVAVAIDATEQTIENTQYGLNAAQDRLVVANGVFAHRVEITYVTGFGAAAAVPKPIRQGMMAHVASMYDNRAQDGDAAMPPVTLGLYAPFREVAL